MLRSYIKVAVRNPIKYKGYSSINILGLAIGIASCILILLFVQHESSYDRYHEKADQIMRLERMGVFQGMEYRTPTSAHPYGPTLVADFPEILQQVRVWDLHLNIRDTKMQFTEEEILFADGSLFDVFSFQLKAGDPHTALKEPSSIVLTESMARRFLDDPAPIGQTLHFMWGDSLMAFKVSGILEDLPANSHVRTEIFASYSSLDIILGELMGVWLGNEIVTYLLLQEDTDIAALEAKFPPFVEKYVANQVRQFLGPDADVSGMIKLKLFPMLDIHLYSNLERELEANGSIIVVYILSGIAFLILVIAAINFMNLSTARSTRRAKEVGLRKVVGAERKLLVAQFLSESVLVSLVALLIGLLIVHSVLPAYNAFTLKELSIDYAQPQMLLAFGAIILLIGIVAGFYPAFILSAFKPATVLKGSHDGKAKGKSSLREILVVVQFGISVVLIVSTLVMADQLEFVRNKWPGFDKEQVVVIPVYDRTVPDKLDVLATELKRNRDILSVAASARYPGSPSFSDTIWRRGGSSGNDFIAMYHFQVNEDFIPTLGMKVAHGRNFSRAFETDRGSVILNESAARQLGWQTPADAVGQEVEVPMSASPDDIARAQVVGVVGDFHFESLRQKIEPLVLHMGAVGGGIHFVFARIGAHDVAATVSFIKATWQKLSPRYPFEYFFLEQGFDGQYEGEKRVQTIFSAFAALAIFVSCLGLLGLSSFAAEQRKKEIGIRKALGATGFNIFTLIGRHFVKLVVVGFAVALPLSYLLASLWLEDFAYRTSISPSSFVMSGAIVIAISMLTVGFQVIRAALSNPVDTLKYE